MYSMLPWMVFTMALVCAGAFVRQQDVVELKGGREDDGGLSWWLSVIALVGLGAFPFVAGMRLISDRDPSPAATVVSAVACGVIAFAGEKALDRIIGSHFRRLQYRPLPAGLDPVLDGDFHRRQIRRAIKLGLRVLLIVLVLSAYWLLGSGGRDWMREAYYGW